MKSRFNLSRFSIQHSWITVCCWLMIAVAGFFAYSSLKYALFPDITFPVVVVNASVPLEESVTEPAIETEALLTIPLEESLESLSGLRQLESSTSAGRSLINMRFAVNASLAETAAAVEQQIAQAALPEQATYDVIPLNLNEATAVSYALFGEGLSLAQLTELATAKIAPPLEAAPGVLRVNVLGTGWINGASSEDAAIGEDEAIGEDAAIGKDAAIGREIAAATHSPTLVRFNQQTAIALQIIKRPEANTLEVVDAIADTLAEIAPQLATAAPSAELQIATTQADYIRAATQATIDSLLGAVAIAILVIFAFLKSWQATLITALAIPLSLLGTCIVMAIYGFNLETITLLGLAIVIGIIVDDAIVEIENIARHIELGATPRQAAFRATEEIGLTVSASTLTIVAVFLPVAFMGGTIGQFFKPFGLTVSAAVLTSLLAARTLTPVLAAYWLSAKPRGATKEAEKVPVSLVERSYSRLLGWALQHRWQVVGIAIASLIAGLAIIPLIPQGFIPQLDRGEFYLTYTTEFSRAAQAQQSEQQISPELLANDPSLLNQTTPRIDLGARLLEQTLAAGETLEAEILQQPGVESVFTTVGDRGRPNEGQIHVALSRDRPLTTAETQAQLRQNLPTLDGVTTSLEDVQFIDTGGEKPLQVVLVGEDLAALNEAAVRVKEEVETLPGFADVKVSSENNSAENIAEINRKNGERIATISANLTAGKALGSATEDVTRLAQSVIPTGIRIDLDGDSARAGEVLGSFGRTLFFAIICMLAVLFIPFGRLLEPAVVGLSLPLSIVGAMLALLITRSDFGIVSLLGLLFLLGLLDKNALLLMDYANQLRRQGMPRTEAILQTGLVRLRPILMTTASTVLGMTPLALGIGAGAELRQPMAVAIIGGLMTSTLLSLVVVPVLYSLLEDGWQSVKSRSQAAKKQPNVF